MDLKLSFLFLDPFPKTGVISANLNEAGNFEEEIAILNWEQIYSYASYSFAWKPLIVLWSFYYPGYIFYCAAHVS